LLSIKKLEQKVDAKLCMESIIEYRSMFWLFINTIILFFQDTDINRFQTRNLAHTPDPRSIGSVKKLLNELKRCKND
jgi:hypothetical protein